MAMKAQASEAGEGAACEMHAEQANNEMDWAKNRTLAFILFTV